MVSAVETMGPCGVGVGVVREDPGGARGAGTRTLREVSSVGARSKVAGGRSYTRSTKSPALTWAATVWDLVGKSFVTQAVLNPASERPNAARKPAPPAPTTTASNS